MFTNIPSAALRQLVKLSERKEALMTQIQEIDRRMVRLQSRFGVPSLSAGHGAPVTISRVKGSQSRRRLTRRGALKAKIVHALRAAGRNGATIRELSKKLGVPSSNLYVW